MIDFESLINEMKLDSQKSIALSTYECYEREIQHYEFVISQIPNADPPFPPTVKSVGAYIAYRKHFNCSYSTIKGSIYALKFYLRKNNLEDVTMHHDIKQYLHGLQRVMKGGFSPFASNAITLKELEKICNGTNLNNFVSVRNTSMMCLQFHLMLRVSEIQNLKFEDIEFAGDIAKFRITKTKTDQTGK